MNGDSHVFVDTNILVYAHDTRAGVRHTAAKAKVASLWQRPLAPAVSVQVLQELHVNLVRKGLTRSEARGAVMDYMRWTVILNDSSLLLQGMDAAARWKISLWDALILVAAKRAGAAILWSEDLNEGQDYDGVVVENPLK